MQKIHYQRYIFTVLHVVGQCIVSVDINNGDLYKAVLLIHAHYNPHDNYKSLMLC
jgi:hypothetical protein